MTGFYDILTKRYDACSPTCHDCEDACSGKMGKPGCAVIKPVHLDEVNFHCVLACIQCSEPKCRDVCPTGAISKSEIDGIVKINAEKCVGCGLCTLACPYGGIYYDQENEKCFKCDTCNGEPACVEACEYGILSYLKSRNIYRYFKDEDLVGQGVSQCAGCAGELALRFTLRVLGREAIYFGCASCVNAAIGSRGIMNMLNAATYTCLMTNVPSSMTGVKRYFRKVGKDVTCVAFVGDGCVSDVGFQPLSGAAERGENLIIICYDNEAYMNTGVQKSGTTPLRARTTTTPVGVKRRGKSQAAKYIPLIMAYHGIPYVATASIAHLEDYAQKLVKAQSVKDGMAYIHLFCPCPTGWGAEMDSAIELSRMAVETNYFPLWEAENGKLRLTYTVTTVKPIREFTTMMGRFRHATEFELNELKDMVDARYALIEALSTLPVSLSGQRDQ